MEAKSEQGLVESGAVATEAELIDGVRAGDPAAMGVLYERHRGQGLQFARNLMSYVYDAEDVLQEAFAKAFSAIRNGYGPEENFGPYLSTSIRSVANTAWKKRSTERLTPSEEMNPDPVEDPALETVLSVFEHEQIAAALRTLPPRWQTVLWHAEVLGERPREIAPLLGIEPNAVSSLLIRARAGLRAAYELQTRPTPAAAGALTGRTARA